MMLTILTGGPGCSQHTRLLEQMHKLAGEKRPSLLLVPESGSHQAERRLLQVCGNRGSAFASVTTFSKLTEDVLAETGCRVTTLDPGGRVLTMHRALAGVQSSLQYYKRASRPQLVEKLVEAASELMACNITPEQLLAAEDPTKFLLPVDSLFADLPTVTVHENQLKAVYNGAALRMKNLEDGTYRVYAPSGEFLMVGLAEQGQVKTVKSFFEVSKP